MGAILGRWGKVVRLAAALAAGGAATAQTVETDPLLALLEEETAAATADRRNADFLPGILTVLTGRDLVERGVPAVWQALNLVPGVHSAPNNFGEHSVTVRGLGFQQHFTPFKVFLDGVPMSSLGEQRTAYLALPVEAVERLEVIRGPGGVVFGAEATSGVISVVTRTAGTGAFGEVGSFGTRRGGARASWADPARRFRAYFQAAASSNDDTGTILRVDAARDVQDVGYAPGEADDEEYTVFASAGLEWGDFSLALRHVGRGFGSFYGFFTLAPDDTYGGGHENFSTASLSHAHEWSDTLSTRVEAVFQRHRLVGSEVVVFPMGATLPGPLPPGAPPRPVAARDQVNRRTHTTDHWTGSAHLVWTGWKAHEWRAEISGRTAEVVDAANDILQSQPGFFPPVEQFFLPAGLTRDTLSLSLQDQISLRENLHLTLGARYDDFSDLGGFWTPAAALAWGPARGHVVKAQFAQGLRPPSFIELYERAIERRTLEPERATTVELSYIYRQAPRTVRATLFHTTLADPIERPQVSGGPDLYGNQADNTSHGFELEWNEELAPWAAVEANVARAWTDHGRGGGAAVPGAQSWLWNAGLRLQPHRHLVVRADWRRVGETARGPLDSGPPIPAYQTVDLTATVSHWPWRGWDLQLGVRNALDEGVGFMPLEQSHPVWLPSPGRYWFAQVSLAL